MRVLEVFTEILAPGGGLLTALTLLGRAWQKREKEHREALEKRDAEWQKRLDEVKAERDEMRTELRQAYKDLALAAHYVQFSKKTSGLPESSGTTPRPLPAIPSLSVETEQRLPPPPRLPRIKTPR